MPAGRHRKTRSLCRNSPPRVGARRMVSMVPLDRLSSDDDPELWAVVLDTILADLTPEPGMAVEVGRCSHWLRSHQTRWTADGGFAAPVGYGSGTGGYSCKALPQFDWSVVLKWSG